MKTVLVIFGTRPEAIKLAPLIAELKTRDSFRTLTVVTGQHREMLDGVLECFGITPDYDLGIFSGERTLGELHAALVSGISELLVHISPELVLVHGDTATALAGATAAFFLQIPVGHVEAGLRSGAIGEPFPEELNRRTITLASSLDFAPTERAEKVLRVEGKTRVFLTGNTVIDTLKTTVRPDFTHPLLSGKMGESLLLLTVHRRENLGEPIRRVFRAVLTVTERFEHVRVILPVHKNPRVREAVTEVFGERSHPRISLVEPLGTVVCHNLVARSRIVLTDSGGLQEEATALGVPLLVLRERTERQEAVEAGAAILVGTDGERIVSALERLLTDRTLYRRMRRPRALFGDGNASVRIADHVTEFLRDSPDSLDKSAAE